MSTAGGAARPLRIGGASGFWGDSRVGAPQLLAAGVDVLVFDYLAELTLAIMAGQRRKDPSAGWATDFVEVTMREILRDAVARGVRLVSNAGGLNPRGCAAALARLAQDLDVTLRIATVTGDDVLPLAAETGALRAFDSGSMAPAARWLTANAYLGALPVKAALDAGAQVVITGRCVDSAVTLGTLMHAFGWADDDWDRLAQGSLAGHIIECGCQATGGLHTDWQQVPDWPDIGYPIVECTADGAFTVTKPAGTGGLVTPATVAEQIVYEIDDPRRYRLPDVYCDFSTVQLEADGPDRVRVTGARGNPPGPDCKVSATWIDGWRCNAQLTVVGFDAAAKARRTGEAILARCRRLFAQQGWADFSAVRIEALGSGTGPYGPHAVACDTREAVLWLAVTHRDREPLELFAREIAPAGTSWAPGTTGAGGRPSPSPRIRQTPLRVAKARLQPLVEIDGTVLAVAVPTALTEPPPLPAMPADGQATAADFDWAAPGQVPLIELAWARSGDKADTANIGIIARRPEWWPHLQAVLTPARVRAWLAHVVRGRVTRHELPGIRALNFVCEQALDGGGLASLRNDPLGKGLAQVLLAMPVPEPPAR